jgi:glycosyltransferase involved in cell wall biosynthesis
MIEADIESIGIVTSHMSFDGHGGANYSRHRLGQELEQRGFDVSIYTLNFSDENHVPVPHDYDLVETRIDSHTIVDGVARFFQQISQYFESNDLIHIYVPGIIPLFGLYRRVTGDDTPLVATLNGYTPFCTDTSRMGDGCWKHCSLSKKIRHGRNGPTGEFTPGNLPRTVFNQYATVPLMNEIDEYLCLSPEVRRIYRDIGVDDDRLNVVPNMIDPEFSDESAPARADGRGDDETRILYVGRVDAMKSIGNLLEAVSRMDTDSGEYRVDIVGDNILEYGQSLDGYRADAQQLGIAGQVTFHGWVDYTDLAPYYADADVFVHPAEWPEPFGRTIIEALEHGLPVVCSRVGAPPWITGSAGITYPRDDPAALANILDGLVETPERVAAMAANARLEVERFTPDDVMADVLGIYSEVSA